MSSKPLKELTEASATALARAIREREVSSLEVIDAHLDRIDAVNPKLNAVVQFDADDARQQARKADAALGSGDAVGRSTACHSRSKIGSRPRASSAPQA